MKTLMSIRTSNSTLRRRRGFTLVELIVVIMIAAILASLSAAAYFKIAANAKVTATEALISQLDAALRERMELFFEETKNVAPSEESRVLAEANQPGKDEPKKRRAVVLERLSAMRECFPQQFADFMRQPVNRSNPTNGDDYAFTETDPDKGQGIGRRAVAYSGRLAIFMEYLRRTNQLVNNQFDPTKSYTTRPANHLATTESAACLYLILSSKTANATFNIDSVPSQYIKDTDGDGIPEFVDAWGKPLRYYRWPTDYVAYMMDIAKQLKPVDTERMGTLSTDKVFSSNLDPDATLTEIDPSGQIGWFDYIKLNRNAPARQYGFEEDGFYRLHPAYDLSIAKPFDAAYDTASMNQKNGAINPLRDVQKVYPLMPLILSSGPDGEFGLYEPDDNRAPFAREMHLRCARPNPEKAEALGDNISNLAIVSGRRQ